MSFTIQNIIGKTANPIFDSSAASIVISFDNNFCLSAAALINSIVRNSSAEKNYDIVILEDKISEQNKMRLLKFTEIHENFSIRFFDINSLFSKEDVFLRTRFPPIVYGRLFIPQIFSAYEKVIYIDTDTVLCSDPAQLLNIDLENNLIAGVKDIVMEGYVQFKVRSTTESGNLEAGIYLQQTLGMQDPSAYIQAGLLIFDINKILHEKKDKELVENIGSFPFWFLDQDVINKVFNGKIKYLSLNWNVYHGNGDTEGFFSKLHPDTYKEYSKARENPHMIHFAGDQKPWINAKVDFYKEFEMNLKATLWEDILYDNLRNTKYSKKLKSKLIPFMNTLFPLGSERRILLRNAFYKLNSFLDK